MCSKQVAYTVYGIINEQSVSLGLIFRDSAKHFSHITCAISIFPDFFHIKWEKSVLVWTFCRSSMWVRYLLFPHLLSQVCSLATDFAVCFKLRWTTLILNLDSLRLVVFWDKLLSSREGFGPSQHVSWLTLNYIFLLPFVTPAACVFFFLFTALLPL